MPKTLKNLTEREITNTQKPGREVACPFNVFDLDEYFAGISPRAEAIRRHLERDDCPLCLARQEANERDKAKQRAATEKFLDWIRKEKANDYPETLAALLAQKGTVRLAQLAPWKQWLVLERDPSPQDRWVGEEELEALAGHFTLRQLHAFLKGRAGEMAAKIEAHVQDCPLCEGWLEELHEAMVESDAQKTWQGIREKVLAEVGPNEVTERTPTPMPTSRSIAAAASGGTAQETMREWPMPGGKIMFNVPPETNDARICFDTTDNDYNGALVWIGLEGAKREDAKEAVVAGYYAVAYPYPGREEFFHGEVRLEPRHIKKLPSEANLDICDSSKESEEPQWSRLVASAQRAEGKAARNAWLSFLRKEAMRKDISEESRNRFDNLATTLEQEWKEGGEGGTSGLRHV